MGFFKENYDKVRGKLKSQTEGKTENTGGLPVKDYVEAADVTLSFEEIMEDDEKYNLPLYLLYGISINEIKDRRVRDLKLPESVKSCLIGANISYLTDLLKRSYIDLAVDAHIGRIYFNRIHLFFTEGKYKNSGENEKIRKQRAKIDNNSEVNSDNTRQIVNTSKDNVDIDSKQVQSQLIEKLFTDNNIDTVENSSFIDNKKQGEFITISSTDSNIRFTADKKTHQLTLYFKKSYLDDEYRDDLDYASWKYDEASQDWHNYYNNSNYSFAEELISKYDQKGDGDGKQQDRVDPEINSKVYSVLKVYDNPQGISPKNIGEIIGYSNEKKIENILKEASWATEVNNNLYRSAEEISNKQNPSKKSEFNSERYKEVLIKRFRNGLQFDSIDFDIFRETYKEYYDEEITVDDDKLEARISECGFVYKDRLFTPEGVIDEETKEKLYSYIDNCFASGIKVLYYKAIYEELSDTFSTCYALSDEKMLRKYIEFTSGNGKYYFSPDYLSLERFVDVDNNTEIENYFLNIGRPASLPEVCKALAYIPDDQITSIVQTNKNLLWNARGEYFHRDIFEVSNDEIEKISNIINEHISESEYAIWTDIWNDIQDKLPMFVENNSYISSIGIRDALARYYKGIFNFESAVISLPNNHFAMGDIYRLFAEHHKTFTAEELNNLSKKLNTAIYYEAVAKVSVRVSHDLFVSRDQIRFDVDAIDSAIGSYMSKDYIRIREIDSFLAFPNTGFEWNEYLLESYLQNYSKEFVLINNGVSLNNVAGVISKRDGKIKTFVDACAAVIAIAPIELKKSEALDYLVDVNMITRRSYKDLESALEKAKKLREKKG